MHPPDVLFLASILGSIKDSIYEVSGLNDQDAQEIDE